jgi:hypothetical protein
MRPGIATAAERAAWEAIAPWLAAVMLLSALVVWLLVALAGTRRRFKRQRSEPDGTGKFRLRDAVSHEGCLLRRHKVVRVGRVHARQVVHVLTEETTLTVYDG